ncbi:hypothetical protein ABIT13_25655, partial [Limnospira fusiformis NRMCF6962]
MLSGVGFHPSRLGANSRQGTIPGFNGELGEIGELELPAWVKETPGHIRQNAIFDAYLAFSASP